MNSLYDLILLDKSIGSDYDYDVDNDSRFQNGHVAIDFRVYKMNEEIGEWVPLKSLGDRVILIGLDCVFSVSAKEFPGWRWWCEMEMKMMFVGDGKMKMLIMIWDVEDDDER